MPDDTLTVTGAEARHPPGSGFLLVNSKIASLSLNILATERYLNQTGINDTYTDAFGRTFVLKQRQELQFQKVNVSLKGFLLDPKFRYIVFFWTANATQGQGAQVVIAGNMQYVFAKQFSLGAGISPLPTVRSLYGQFPFWLRQDARPMADEFFRGSFSTGVFIQGELGGGFYYKSMVANNLSQLGVDAGQLNNGFNTSSTAVWWLSKDYGALAPYGDFEKHDNIAGMLGTSYTTSGETSQSQPNANDPENSQIRLSDGTSVFGINSFAPNSQVLSAHYQMHSINGGLKYKGFSLDGEYFTRWVALTQVRGVIPVKNLFDNGFTIQASAMLVDRTLQFYSTGSHINGQYGKPTEITCGFNYMPFHSRVFRVNPEVMFENRVPVGYLSYPTVIGAKGPIYMVNLEIFY